MPAEVSTADKKVKIDNQQNLKTAKNEGAAEKKKQKDESAL